MSTDPLLSPASQLSAEYRAKRLSPVEVTRAVLDRISKLNPIYNAFVLVDEESALQAARESEARWRRGEPLGRVDGVPTTVKDLILAKGWPTLRGSRTINPKQDWNEDGPPVARLREQGAIILGKTTTPEFGWKGVTDSPLTGVTRNPWDKRMTPGGSSGGAAVACALGMGTMNVATDGGGSIRIPAGFCGLFGFKPTWGLVPVHPHSPAGTLWHQGPIARTVEDAALMLSIIAQPDARDWYASPPLGLDFERELERGVRGLRIAYSDTLGYAKVDTEVAHLVRRAVAQFAELGARVEDANLEMQDPIAIMQPLWSVALALAVAPMSAEQKALAEPAMLALAEAGFRLSALEYRQLERAREALGRRMEEFHRQYDLLITPQLATTAFEAGVEVPAGHGMERWWQWSPFTYLFNLTQQPAATVPCGFAANGLPVAMQLVGAKFNDPLVLRAARAFEAVQPFVMVTGET
jgi:aspartyl-tRNA(Asn)/glutamyl-tRNA(Gln) amidotransferase subunit A